MLHRWRGGKESASQSRRHKRCRFDPCVRKIPWSGKIQPTPVFLPGKFHGQRNLVGCSPWDHKKSDTAEHTCTVHCLGPGLYRNLMTEDNIQIHLKWIFAISNRQRTQIDIVSDCWYCQSPSFNHTSVMKIVSNSILTKGVTA